MRNSRERSLSKLATWVFFVLIAQTAGCWLSQGSSVSSTDSGPDTDTDTDTECFEGDYYITDDSDVAALVPY